MAPEPRRAPTLADVGVAAGVSHQTVSRAINSPQGVRPETLDRVQRAIAELGYRPNTAARTLATSRSGAIGLLTAQITDYGPSSLVASIDASLRTAGYHTVLAVATEPDAHAVHEAAEVLIKQSIEALVVTAPHRAELDLSQTVHLSVPVLFAGGDARGATLTAGVDQILGGRLATRHLLELGHETVVHLGGPAYSTEARARRVGWERELRAWGRAVPGVALSGDWTPRSGHDVGSLIAPQPGLTAVFAANDQMALGLIRALDEAGVDVPGDVSVVGFDDIPEAEYFRPPLTTVAQDFVEVGRRVSELVFRSLAGEAAPAIEVVAPRLVLRASTGPPAVLDLVG